MKNKFISLNNLKYFWITIKAWIDENILRIDKDILILKDKVGITRTNIPLTEGEEDGKKILVSDYIYTDATYMYVKKTNYDWVQIKIFHYDKNGEIVRTVDKSMAGVIELNLYLEKIYESAYLKIKFIDETESQNALTDLVVDLLPKNIVYDNIQFLTNDEIDLITTEVFGGGSGSSSGGSGTNTVGDV